MAAPDSAGTQGWFAFLTDRGETGLREPGCAPSTRRKRQRAVQAVILVPVETALDLSDHAAELLGYGPISGAHARELLATAELRKACTDRHTGRMLSLDPPEPEPGPEREPDAGPGPGEPPGPSSPPPTPKTPRAHRPAPEPDPALKHITIPTDVLLDLRLIELALRPSTLMDQTEPQHDPSAPLADLIRLRDTRCTGPGCATPSHLCDLEHATPYPTGPTSADNVGPVSRRCHNAKTHGGWTLTPHPDGSVTWTSALGQQPHHPTPPAPPRPQIPGAAPPDLAPAPRRDRPQPHLPPQHLTLRAD